MRGKQAVQSAPPAGSADFTHTLTHACLAECLPACCPSIHPQAREYLYWKLHGAQHTTPVAIMTSAAKGNHWRVEQLFEQADWFGRWAAVLGERCGGRLDGQQSGLCGLPAGAQSSALSLTPESVFTRHAGARPASACSSSRWCPWCAPRTAAGCCRTRCRWVLCLLGGACGAGHLQAGSSIAYVLACTATSLLHVLARHSTTLCCLHLLNNSWQVMMKPGGHGVIWKLMIDAGVFDWLGAQGRQAAIVRQIRCRMMN